MKGALTKSEVLPVPDAIGQIAGMQAVTLIQVNTAEEEAAVTAELGRLTEQVGMPVAPVLNYDGFLQRITQVLSDAGCDVRCVSREGLMPLANPVLPIIGFIPPSRPMAVFASAGVNSDILALAAGLCGVRPQFLSDLPDALALDPQPTSALLLVNPEKAEIQDTASAMSFLAEKGVYVGILYTVDPIDSRLAIIKSLLLGSICSRGVSTILSMQHNSASATEPAWLQNASTVEGRRRFGRHQDLLLVSGHANPLDAALGAEAGLCARASIGGMGATEGLFPCFGDGKCFRQPLMGRQPDDLDGLVGLHEAKANVIVLSGCCVATLGKTWFNARHGLAYQCQHYSRIASAVSSSVMLEKLELDLLFVALLAEGLPLGKIVSEVNRVRTEAHGHATSYGPGVGPFILLGNPCLRIKGFDLQDAAVTAGKSTQNFSVNLADVRFDEERCTVLRMSLPKTASLPFVFLQSTLDDVWCRGVCYPTDDAIMLYLWVSISMLQSESDRQLDFEYRMDDPSDLVCTSIKRFLTQFPFWTMVLKSYCTRAENGGLPLESVELALSSLPEALQEFSQCVTALNTPRGIVVETQTTRAIANASWSKIGYLTSTLLTCLVDITCQFGTQLLSSWEASFLRLDSLGPLAPCTCGSPVWGQQYRYPDGGLLERANYQCPTCGPIGEDDCRCLLRITDLPHRVEQGEWITATGECSAPDGELVHIRAVAVIESLLRDRRMVGQVIAEMVRPGRIQRLALNVKVPEDLPPGVYPVAFLAIVNGAFYAIRQMVQVTRARSGKLHAAH